MFLARHAGSSVLVTSDIYSATESSVFWKQQVNRGNEPNFRLKSSGLNPIDVKNCDLFIFFEGGDIRSLTLELLLLLSASTSASVISKLLVNASVLAELLLLLLPVERLVRLTRLDIPLFLRLFTGNYHDSSLATITTPH